jgi:glycosyltransferase involved in cell wall biosynthesis
VATSAGGLPEIITDESTGLLYPPGDIEALAGAVSRLLADGTLHEDLAERARRSVVARFTVDAYAEGVERVLEEALSQSRFCRSPSPGR